MRWRLARTNVIFLLQYVMEFLKSNKFRNFNVFSAVVFSLNSRPNTRHSKCFITVVTPWNRCLSTCWRLQQIASWQHSRVVDSRASECYSDELEHETWLVVCPKYRENFCSYALITNNKYRQKYKFAYHLTLHHIKPQKKNAAANQFTVGKLSFVSMMSITAFGGPSILFIPHSHPDRSLAHVMLCKSINYPPPCFPALPLLSLSRIQDENTDGTNDSMQWADELATKPMCLVQQTSINHIFVATPDDRLHCKQWLFQIHAFLTCFFCIARGKLDETSRMWGLSGVVA